jgi:hypothetical protein
MFCVDRLINLKEACWKDNNNEVEKNWRNSITRVSNRDY